MAQNYCLPMTTEENRTKYENNLKNLIKYGLDINKNLVELEKFANQREDFTNNYTFMTGGDKTLSDKNKDLVNANTTQNGFNKSFNQNREILLRKEQMNQLENEDIENQYKRLDQIQSSIFSKERLIEENLYHSEKSERNIRVLTASILFVLLLFIIVGVYYTKKIDNVKFVK